MENHKAPPSVNGSSFALNLCEKLHTFILDGRFSDVCLKTSDGVEFRAHKIIISASSEYFMAMFDSNMQESSANEVQLKNVTGDDFQPIITYLYTGKINLQSDTIEQILRTANFFQISALISQCYFFMSELLDTKNWVSVALFAHQHEFADLLGKVINFANKNSEAIFNEEEFLSLEDDLIYAIVSHKDLNVNSEEKLFFSLVRWMDYDRQNREEKALKLFTAIRYWRLTEAFIKQAKSKLPDDLEYLKMIWSWLERHSLSADQRALQPVGLFDPTEEIQGLLLFGNKKIQIYNEELNSWTVRRCSNLPETHIGQVIAFKEKLLYSTSWDNIHLFDLRTGQVKNLPPLKDKYNRPYAIVIFEEELYLLSKYSQYSQKFNFYFSTWSRISSPYRYVVENLKAGVINGELYAYLPDKGEFLFYQGPDEHEAWSRRWASDIDKGNSLFTEIGEDLYKIYGPNPWRLPNIIEKISKSSSVSRVGKTEFDMLTLQCVSWKNRLVIYGRTHDQKNIVQEFNPETRKWKTLPVLIDEDDSYTLVVV